ncbi:LexA family protein [Floccifex sp.]|uniref:LexA family protein n=1 Tax=Floccifex sp. TaxID=2815810 RepID=UPI002A74E97C|nr:S24 family peptidase [Floccifex sp.]MDD7281345.1 S24 family peptidase [Erysipelotrichaceae bacterium]MDY2958191.1 S24 family peptidase [Floccifex sp.]
MNIQEIINEYKRQTHVTNEFIAKEIGVTKSTVSRWCNGQIKKINPDTLKKLSDLLGLDFEQMTSIAQFTFEKPILGTVKAGYGLFAEENIEGYLAVSESEYQQGDYFLRVEGNSMIDAKIHDQDLLYVKAVNDVNTNTIAIVLIEREEVTVKRVIKKKEGLILEAANPYIESRTFTWQEVEELPVQIIGKVIYARRNF